MPPFIAAGLHSGDTEVLQGIGVRLPTDTEDHAVCDLAVVDDDVEDHPVENNAYDPRLLASRPGSDLREPEERSRQPPASKGQRRGQVIMACGAAIARAGSGACGCGGTRTGQTPAAPGLGAVTHLRSASRGP